VNGGSGYLVAFAVAAALSLVLTPAMMRVATRRSVLDEPTDDKNHGSAVPLLGGVAISLSFLIAVGVAAVIDPPGPRSGELATVLIVAGLLTVVGLVDDLRGLSIGLRLGIECAGALAIWRFGEGANLSGIPVVDAMITVIWIVGVVNAFNLLDHHDGLSVGVGIIAAAWFFLIAALNGQHLVAALSIGLVGCALGFLRLNFPPARIFMGDAGSLFIGFLLAVIGLKLVFPDNDKTVTFLTPIFVVGVALFDTTLVVISRLCSGVSPTQGGRDHTAHRLGVLGLPGRAVDILLYVAAISAGWVGFIISRSERLPAYLLAGLAAFVSTVAAVVLLAIPVPGARTPAGITRVRRLLGWD